MDKSNKIIKLLEKYYKKRIGSVHKQDPFKVLVACIISQRTREENTDKAVKQLFKKAKIPKQILKLSIRELEQLIKPAGFYRQKAKRIKQVCKILLKKGTPKTREELLKLPGVGFKTADVVLAYGYNIPAIPVDTHVNRISKRLGLVDKKAKAEEVRRQLENIFPKNKWHAINLGFVNFGRDICIPRKPKCYICSFRNFCKAFRLQRFNVKPV